MLLSVSRILHVSKIDLILNLHSPLPHSNVFRCRNALRTGRKLKILTPIFTLYQGRETSFASGLAHRRLNVANGKADTPIV